MKSRHHFWLLALAFVLILIGGTFVYHDLEGWSYLDSSYFLVITATTIGYGDLTPQTNLGKIITMIYSFIGMAFVFYVISLISHKVFERKLEERVEGIKEKKKLKKSVKKV